MIDKEYKRLLEGNSLWAQTKKFNDPEYFKKLSLTQKPQYLWIGCSDSRVPANEITNTVSGEVFVHRNIANLALVNDMNMLSVLDYAVSILGVKHIIVCGHYGCGGIKAAMSQESFGFVDSWLRNIKEIYNKHCKELDAIVDIEERANRLTELNVIEAVANLAKTKTVQRAWKERTLQIHGWVYGLNDGLIKELDTIIDNPDDLPSIFRYSQLGAEAQ
jgi:carbonic anhydrase